MEKSIIEGIWSSCYLLFQEVEKNKQTNYHCDGHIFSCYPGGAYFRASVNPGRLKLYTYAF